MDESSKRLIDHIRSIGYDILEEEPQPEDNKSEHLKRVQASGIPKRYFNATFEDITFKGCPETVRPMAEDAWRYAKHLKENAEKGMGLLFFGEVGRMKTTLACCVANEAIRQGMGVFFISMPELLDNMISMSKSRDSTELVRFEEKIKNVTFLILDDFGAEYPKDWVLNKVDAIITNRYNNMKPVIITTNMLPDEIQERYVQRVFDRLRSTSKVIGTYGESLRKDAE